MRQSRRAATGSPVKPQETKMPEQTQPTQAPAATQTEAPNPTVAVAVATPDEQARVVALSQMAEQEWLQAQRDNKVRDFLGDVMKARNVQEPEYVPPPPAPAILQRTNEEMAAGQRAVAQRAAEEALRPKRPVEEPHGAKTVAVFRPRDFIPDPKRNTGHVQVKTLASE